MQSVRTYQDLLALNQDRKELTDFVKTVLDQHKMSKLYKTAVDADLYDRQRNVTINEFVKAIFTLSGDKMLDYTVSNMKIASNLFRRLNTQRNMYSLGNGVSFESDKKAAGGQGIKDKLGVDFDTRLKRLAYKGLIHGVSFGFWNVDRLYVFPVTEFAPLWNEKDGSLGAGIRFWQIAEDKPLIAVLYTKKGTLRFESDSRTPNLHLVDQKPRPYKQTVRFTDAGDREVIDTQNYSSLPVIPLWGSELHQSTLVGLQQSIDSYDLIRSGFANDLSDCSEIYWIISNAGGMTENDLIKFRDRLKLTHIAEVNGDAGQSITPQVLNMPYEARSQFLALIKAGMYEDFGALDVHTIAAGATNDHIDAAYQPLDENADDFEYQIIEFVQQLLRVMGLEPETPLFKRNRISNQLEQVQMLVQEQGWLDTETILTHLPNITVDEIPDIMKRREAEEQAAIERALEAAAGGENNGPDEDLD